MRDIIPYASTTNYKTNVLYLENCAENDGDSVRFSLNVHSFVIPELKKL